MSEPQIWTALGILAAAFASMVVVMTKLVTRIISEGLGKLSIHIDAKIESTHAKIDATHTRIDSTFGAIEALRSEMMVRFDEIDRRFVRLEKQVDNLDGDVQAISRKVFPD